MHIYFPKKYLKYLFSPIILTKIKWKHLTHSNSMREIKERKERERKKSSFNKIRAINSFHCFLFPIKVIRLYNDEKKALHRKLNNIWKGGILVLYTNNMQNLKCKNVNFKKIIELVEIFLVLRKYPKNSGTEHMHNSITREIF